MSEEAAKGNIFVMGPKGSGKSTFITFLKTGNVTNNYFKTIGAQYETLEWASQALKTELGIKIELRGALDTEGSIASFATPTRIHTLRKLKEALEKQNIPGYNQYNIFLFYFINTYELLNQKRKPNLFQRVFKKESNFPWIRIAIRNDTSWLKEQKAFFKDIDNLYTSIVFTHIDRVNSDINSIRDEIFSEDFNEIMELYSVLSEIGTGNHIFFGSLKDNHHAKLLIKDIFSYFINLLK